MADVKIIIYKILSIFLKLVEKSNSTRKWNLRPTPTNAKVSISLSSRSKNEIRYKMNK